MKVVLAVLVLVGSTMAEFPATCPNVTVLHSVTKDGWYDGCLGLDNKVDAGTVELCKAQCYADMNCSVWQVVKSGDDMKCWSGSVTHGCLDRDTGSSALSKFEGDLIDGERVQHGFIKVVSENSHKETMGLLNIQEDTGDEATLIDRCKKFCETSITCTVWEYGTTGCWLEHLPGNPAGEVKTNSTFAQTMKAGQTIEHTCPPYEAPEELPWPLIIAGIVAALVAIAALIYFLTRKEPKVKKTRAVKIEPKPEPQPSIVYFVPQPTVLVSQPSYVTEYVTAPLIVR